MLLGKHDLKSISPATNLRQILQNVYYYREPPHTEHDISLEGQRGDILTFFGKIYMARKTVISSIHIMEAKSDGKAKKPWYLGPTTSKEDFPLNNIPYKSRTGIHLVYTQVEEILKALLSSNNVGIVLDRLDNPQTWKDYSDPSKDLLKLALESTMVSWWAEIQKPGNGGNKTNLIRNTARWFYGATQIASSWDTHLLEHGDVHLLLQDLAATTLFSTWFDLPNLPDQEAVAIDNTDPEFFLGFTLSRIHQQQAASLQLKKLYNNLLVPHTTGINTVNEDGQSVILLTPGGKIIFNTIVDQLRQHLHHSYLLEINQAVMGRVLSPQEVALAEEHFEVFEPPVASYSQIVAAQNTTREDIEQLQGGQANAHMADLIRKQQAKQRANDDKAADRANALGLKKLKRKLEDKTLIQISLPTSEEEEQTPIPNSTHSGIYILFSFWKTNNLSTCLESAGEEAPAKKQRITKSSMF